MHYVESTAFPDLKMFLQCTTAIPATVPLTVLVQSLFLLDRRDTVFWPLSPMTLDVARCRALLAPWRAQVELAKSCLSVFSIEIALPSLPPAARPAFFLRLREAFELLEMLAVAEQLSWGDLLSTLRSSRPSWGYSSLQQAGKESAFVATGHFLTRKDRYYTGPDVVELAAIYFAFDERSMSTEFQDAVQEIHAAASPEAKRRLEQLTPTPIVLSFSMQNAPKSTAPSVFLRSIGALATRITARANKERTRDDNNNADSGERQARAYRFPFTLKRVEVANVGVCSVHDPDVSAALTELVALGVDLGDLEVQLSSWFMRAPIPQLGPVLQGFTDEDSLCSALSVEKLVPPAPRPQLRLTNFTSFEAETRMSAARAHARERQLSAVFSSLVAVQDVSEVELSLARLDKAPRDRVALLKWITYAFFSKDTTATVSAVEFSLPDATTDEISVVTRVLAAKNPARALLAVEEDEEDSGSRAASAESGREHSEDAPPSSSASSQTTDEDDRDLGFAVLKTGTLVRIKPLGLANKPTDSFELPQAGRFRIVQDATSDSDMVELLVPCYGHCLVALASIERIDEATDNTAVSSLDVGYRGPVEALRVSETDFNTVLPLVRFVGAKLRELSVVEVSVTNDDVRSMLTLCPNLTTLSLGDVGAGVDQLFADAYAHGGCKISSLAVEGFRYNELGGRPNALVQALEDPTSGATKTLRQLSVFNMEPAVVGEAEFSAYVRMLTVNRTLEYLTLNVLNGRLKSRVWMLTKTNGLWLPGRSLKLRNKCAFLSVVRFHSSGAGEERARKRVRVSDAGNNPVGGVDLGQLDSSVVALIFSFAADGVSRKVEVDRYEYDSDDDGHGGSDGDDSDDDPGFHHGFRFW